MHVGVCVSSHRPQQSVFVHVFRSHYLGQALVGTLAAAFVTSLIRMASSSSSWSVWREAGKRAGRWQQEQWTSWQPQPSWTPADRWQQGRISRSKRPFSELSEEQLLQEEERWTKKEEHALQTQAELLHKASATGDGVSGIGDEYVQDLFKSHRRQTRRTLNQLTKEKRIRGLLPDEQLSGADYRELAAQRLSHQFNRPAVDGHGSQMVKRRRQAKSEDGGGAGGATTSIKEETSPENDNDPDAPWQLALAVGSRSKTEAESEDNECGPRQLAPVVGGAKDDANSEESDTESWGHWQPAMAIGSGSKTEAESEDDDCGPRQLVPVAGGAKDEAKSEEDDDESWGPWQPALAVGSGSKTAKVEAESEDDDWGPWSSSGKAKRQATPTQAKWSAVGDVIPNHRANVAHQQFPIGAPPQRPAQRPAQRPIGMSEEHWQRLARRGSVSASAAGDRRVGSR